jgi:4-hydroxybenzoate polyprenyltransferase
LACIAWGRYDELVCGSSVIHIGDILDSCVRYNLCSSGITFSTCLIQQDKSDDIQIGIKSTALCFGSATKPILTTFTLAQLSLLSAAGLLIDVGIPYYANVVATGILQGWMIFAVNIDDEESCGMGFRRNVWTGGIIWLGCLGEWTSRVGGMGLGAW